MQLTYGRWRATASTNRKAGGIAPREAQHLMALASGLSAKQIAQEFGVSVGTVRHSLRRIYQRLNVERAPAAVAQAVRLKIIAPLLIAMAITGINPDAMVMRHRPPMRTRQQVSATARVNRRDLGSIYA